MTHLMRTASHPTAATNVTLPEFLFAAPVHGLCVPRNNQLSYFMFHSHTCERLVCVAFSIVKESATGPNVDKKERPALHCSCTENKIGGCVVCVRVTADQEMKSPSTWESTHPLSELQRLILFYQCRPWAARPILATSHPTALLTTVGFFEGKRGSLTPYLSLSLHHPPLAAPGLTKAHVSPHASLLPRRAP